LRVTVKFHRALRKFTNGCAEHTFTANSYLEVIRACTSLFPQFEKFIGSIGLRKAKNQEIALIVNKQTISPEKIMMRPKDNSIINIVPIILGHGKSLFMYIGMAILFIALVVIAAPLAGGVAAGGAAALGTATAAGGVAGGAAALGGISLASAAGLLLGVALTLVTALIAPKPPTPQTATTDSSQRRNNDAFEGLANTTRAGTHVQLNYGLMRVAGQFISGYVKTLNHGESDVVTVSGQFT
jgi:predicted phage tail protein